MTGLLSIDVETDGPCPGLYSMISFGIVVVRAELKLDDQNTFYGKVAPISENYIQEALDVSGTTREQHLSYPDPKVEMDRAFDWIGDLPEDRYIMVSDNPAFDWQFINYYFHKYVGSNPLGFSARRIGDIYSGATRSLPSHSDWKKFRKTKHTHNPVDDAMGNAEALNEIISRYDISPGSLIK